MNSAFLGRSLATDLFGLGLNRGLLNELKKNLTDEEALNQTSAVEKTQELYEIGHLIRDRYLVLDYRDISTVSGKVFFCMDSCDRTLCVIKKIPVKFDNLIENARTNKINNSKHIAINKLLRRYYGANSEAEYFATLPLHNNIVCLLRVALTGTSILLVQEWLPNTLSDLLIDPFLLEK